MHTAVAVGLYLGAIVAANLSVAAYGPVVAPLNGFVLIGLDLVLRDGLHDRWQGRNLFARMFYLIAAGGVLSYVLNPAAATIAVASGVAFALAAQADAVVYHLLRGRRWLIRANGSNVAGAAVDSLVFPWVAFASLDPGVVAAMFAAKLGGGLFWSVVLRRDFRPPEKEDRPATT